MTFSLFRVSCCRFLFCGLLLLVFSCASSNNCYSLIDVAYSDFGYVIGSEGEPIMACEMWATLDNSPIVLTVDNTKLVQSKSAFITNISIKPPKANGKQTISWGLEIGLPHDIEFEAIVTEQQEVGFVQLPGLPEFKGYNAAFYDVDLYGKRTMIQQVDFTNDNRQYVWFYVSGDNNAADVISSRPWVDSITFTNPNITYDCWPYDPAAKPPPCHIVLNTLYRIELRYNEPAGDPYMRDWMIIHFGGGIKYRFEIVAHEFHIENKPLLTLLNPVGGEHFAPCEEVLIEWEGHNPNYPTSIDFSSDGTNWNRIRNIPGDSSNYLWTVPATISDNCYIKISQSEYSPTKIPLSYDEATIHSAVFNEINNNMATKILTASSLNNVIEWDLFPIYATTRINIGDTSIITSAIYTDSNRIVALDSRNKQLLFYNSGDNTQQKNIKLTNLPDTYKPFSMQCDAKQRFILIEPEKEYGNTLIFTDTAGNYVTKLTEYTAFTDVYLSENEDKLYYSLIDNTIRSVSLANFPNFSQYEQFDFAKDYNIINGLTVSSDGNMIGIATRKPAPGDETLTLRQHTDNIIFDKRIDKVFKNLKVNISPAFSLEFSPASTIAMVASPESPQMMFVDLTNNNQIYWANNPIDNLQGVTASKTGNAMIAYSCGKFNTTYISFVVPEWQQNKTPFSITSPSLTLADAQQAQLNDLLIGTTDTVTLEMQLCNNGLSKIEITSAGFESNGTFELERSTITYPIILLPGECTTIHIIAHPNDTGLITKLLHFTDKCNQGYDLQFSITGINRKLTLLVDTIDFGTNCINDTITLEDVVLFRNDDSIDVIINNIEGNNPHFRVIGYSRDVVLKPGEAYIATLIFAPPTGIGEHTGFYTVYYANQWNVTLKIPAKAQTVGTEFELSHRTLPFIPEEPTRTFTFANTGDATVTIENINLQPEGLYVCNTAMPQVVQPGQLIEITVTCIEPSNIQPAILTIQTAPCLRGNNTVNLRPYHGSAQLWMTDIQADPKDTDFEIPILFKQTENYAYNGLRPFESTITINSTLFYPKYVTSKYGDEIEITNNKTIGNTRNISIRFKGNFNDNNDTLLVIHGIVTLGDVDSTDIDWNMQSKFFGENVDITTTKGSLKLINLCEDRLVNITNANALELTDLAPFPTSDMITVDYQILEPSDKSRINNMLPANSDAKLLLYDLTGALVLQRKIDSSIGKHSEAIDMTNLANGYYLLHICYGDYIVSATIVKQ